MEHSTENIVSLTDFPDFADLTTGDGGRRSEAGTLQDGSIENRITHAITFPRLIRPLNLVKIVFEMRVYTLAFLIVAAICFTFLVPAYAQPLPEHTVKTYDDHGKLRSEVVVLNGVKHGEEKSYYTDGTVASRFNYVNGKRDGAQSTYHANGKLDSEWRESHGEILGAYKRYDEQGTVVSERHYQNGARITETGEVFNGEDVRVDNKSGVTDRVQYVNGKIEGTRTQHSKEGALIAEALYSNNELNGVAKAYYPDGKIESESTYADDELNGPRTLYSRDGSIYSVEHFQNGLLHGLGRYFYKGKLLSEYEYKEGVEDGVNREYFPSGAISAEWEMRNDKENGFNRGYYENGNLEFESRYINGAQVGAAHHYYEDGHEKSDGFVPKGEGAFWLVGMVWYIAFVFSLTCHEAAHAWSAHKLGDSTAHDGGQVTLHPLPHIKREPVGTVLVPILSYIYGGWMIGWASAPIDVRWMYRYPKRSAIVSLAGPVANFLIMLGAAAFILIGLKFHLLVEPETIGYENIALSAYPGALVGLATLLNVLFTLNLMLFVFNLLPFPPLDGSGVLPLILPDDIAQKFNEFIRQPSVSFIGLIIAWKSFGAVFHQIFPLAINLLYPGVYTFK